MFSLFKKKKIEKDSLILEYYPRTHRWYVKHSNGGYLRQDFMTGLIEINPVYMGMTFATYSCSKEEAMKLVDLYKEQILKDGVIKITL